MEFIFNPSKEGLETVMKDYQVLTMKCLWERGEEGTPSGKAWVEVNKILLERGTSKSRASIIFFLQDMAEKGIVKYHERSGKGGYHRVYTPLYDEAGFKELIANQLIEKLIENFPDETKNVIRKIMEKAEPSID